MDTKRLYVDFHVLQTVPPSCVNRDDTGSPKTAVYGGATRARVSSQAWKHAIREMFKDEYMLNAEDIGSRTKKIADVVEKQIKLLAPDADAAKLAKKVVKNTGFKVDEKSGEDKLKTLFFLSEAQAKALAELAIADCNDPKQYKDALDGSFGRYGVVRKNGGRCAFPELRCRRSGGPQHLHPCRTERV